MTDTNQVSPTRAGFDPKRALEFARSEVFERTFKEGMALVEETAAYLDGPDVLLVIKANQRSTVHRRVHYDVVAIKRLLPHLVEDPEFTEMLLKEARLAARVRHPNVVPTLDVVAYAGEQFGGVKPANFLDIGGSSNPEKVVNALRIKRFVCSVLHAIRDIDNGLLRDRGGAFPVIRVELWRLHRETTLRTNSSVVSVGHTLLTSPTHSITAESPMSSARTETRSSHASPTSQLATVLVLQSVSLPSVVACRSMVTLPAIVTGAVSGSLVNRTMSLRPSSGAWSTGPASACRTPDSCRSRWSWPRRSSPRRARP